MKEKNQRLQFKRCWFKKNIVNFIPNRQRHYNQSYFFLVLKSICIKYSYIEITTGKILKSQLKIEFTIISFFLRTPLRYLRINLIPSLEHPFKIHRFTSLSVLRRKQRRRRVDVGRDWRGWRQRERRNGGERIDSREQQQPRLQRSEATPGRWRGSAGV